MIHITCFRVLSEKKRMENAGGGGPGGHHRFRDTETEEFIEDQQQRIRELEQQNGLLKVMTCYFTQKF